MRISIKQIESQIDYLNEITKQPATPWSRVGNRNQANIGNYHLSQAYGGVCLHQMTSSGGGVTCPLNQGHVPKRELIDKLQAFIAGINLS